MVEARLRGGIITGHDHTIRKKNCQDGYHFEQVDIEGKKYWIGAVSDGCSQGNKSEVGALLLPLFVVQQIKCLLSKKTPLVHIPYYLYSYIIGFLEGIRKSIPSIGNVTESINFVQSYLLATVLAFVVDSQNFIVFHAGDGYVVLNERIIRIEHDNRSPYIGYHLIPRASLIAEASRLPNNFTIERFRRLKTKNIKRLAIVTDGFSDDLLKRLWQESYDVPLGLQLWMNKINGPRNNYQEEGIFVDDAAIVVFERNNEGGGDDE